MLNLLIGVLVWQLVTTIVFLVTREDEKATMVCGMGLPFAILYIAVGAFRKKSKNFSKPLDKSKQAWYNVITVKERDTFLIKRSLQNGKNCWHTKGAGLQSLS